MNSLSVVVIGRNEEDKIGRCLQSAIAASSRIPGAEIVMVDSASTDRTVEIARSYDIRVISLKPEWEKSASAGRFVGFHKTTGELVMFIDGDTTIDREWLQLAIPYFDRMEVAALTGYLTHRTEQGDALPYGRPRSADVVPVPWLQGIGMYRRAALNEVGTFNPYLREEEEAELAFRLRRNGWQLLQVPHQMGDHLRGATFADSIKRGILNGRFIPLGRTLRYSVKVGNGMRFLFERYRPTVIFAMATLALLAAIVTSLQGHRLLAEVTFASVALAFIAIAGRKRSLLGPFLYCAKHSMILYGLVVGFVKTEIKEPCDYPLNADEVTSRTAEPVGWKNGHVA